MADEYIKREDAFTTLTEFYHHTLGVQREALREALNRVPTADVRPVVHAHWEYDRKEDCAICSNCNDEIYLGTYHQFSNNYCPNCGAMMDLEE